MLMTERVPAEAWHGDVIGPLVPQRRTLFATAIIEEKWILATILWLYASIEYLINRRSLR